MKKFSPPFHNRIYNETLAIYFFWIYVAIGVLGSIQAYRLRSKKYALMVAVALGLLYILYRFLKKPASELPRAKTSHK
jgi:hypothetical protein